MAADQGQDDDGEDEVEESRKVVVVDHLAGEERMGGIHSQQVAYLQVPSC